MQNSKPAKRPIYYVVVGNVGTVHESFSKSAAVSNYHEYVRMSKTGMGRAANEDVTLMQDDDPIKEHHRIDPEELKRAKQ